MSDITGGSPASAIEHVRMSPRTPAADACHHRRATHQNDRRAAAVVGGW